MIKFALGRNLNGSRDGDGALLVWCFLFQPSGVLPCGGDGEEDGGAVARGGAGCCGVWPV